MKFQFPPYGRFAREYQDTVHAGSLAPPSWRPALAAVEREASFLEWRNETISLINDFLWPQWDVASSSWLNGNHSDMMTLTLADFKLFSEIEHSGVFYDQPVSPVGAASIPSHREYFEDEDTGQFANRYHFYDTTLPSGRLAKIVPDFKEILKKKTGSVSIQIKQLLQRPRAYQIAEMLGRGHKYELATTSMTSSMSSGHCFEGCLVAVGIFETWLLETVKPTCDQTRALGQFGVDVGDRRVFAGVHYPSDNLASWIMSLRLVGEVSADVRIRQFLANAITNQSYIFRLLKDAGDPAHMEAIRLIQSLASSPPG
jgi:hypothetical protein